MIYSKLQPHDEFSRDVVITVKDAKSRDIRPTSGPWSPQQIRDHFAALLLIRETVATLSPGWLCFFFVAGGKNYGHDHRLTLKHVYTRHK